jgi:chromosomal replication initiator protein
VFMPTIRDIQAAVAARYGVQPATLAETKTGGRGDARPRLLVMWLARQCTPYTLARIGRHFGGRDHKTVAHAIQRVEWLMRTDRQLAETATSLREALA